MLKVGIIGCGNIFTMHATSCDYLQNAKLVAVCDIKKDRADKAAKKYSAKAYYDYKELIDNETLDVVHVCVPHYMHPVISRYALEKGVNVLNLTCPFVVKTQKIVLRGKSVSSKQGIKKPRR